MRYICVHKHMVINGSHHGVDVKGFGRHGIDWLGSLTGAGDKLTSVVDVVLCCC